MCDIDIKLIPIQPGRGGIRAGFKGFLEKRAEKRKGSSYVPTEFIHPIHQMFEIREIARVGIALRMKRIDGGKNAPATRLGIIRLTWRGNDERFVAVDFSP